MIILVAGATGKTGRSLVKQLLDAGHLVRIIVRSSTKVSNEILSHPNLSITEAAVLDLSDAELERQVKNCSAVVSCLGHTVDFKGLFGYPKLLCTDATRRLCAAIERNHPSTPVRFILMSSVGVANPDCDKSRSLPEWVVLSILRHALPPHRDNEAAARYLCEIIGNNNPAIEWCGVRPDSLINAEISPYEIIPSPVTGIFDGRPTARANVANFMLNLIENTSLWSEWRFRTPVIMDRSNFELDTGCK